MKMSSFKTKQTTAQIYTDSAYSAFLKFPACLTSKGQGGMWLDNQLIFSDRLIEKFGHSILNAKVKNFSKISEVKLSSTSFTIICLIILVSFKNFNILDSRVVFESKNIKAIS